MNRDEFEALRDIPGKEIRENIRFAKKLVTAPALVAEVSISNALGADLRLNITFNPEVGSKTFNVHAPKVGPICRLDVDGAPHRPAGRSHQHALQTPACPDENLPRVDDRPDLSGKSLRALFDVFCKLGNIQHIGSFESPDEHDQN